MDEQVGEALLQLLSEYSTTNEDGLEFCSHVTIWSNASWVIYDDDGLSVESGASLCDLKVHLDLSAPAEIVLNGTTYKRAEPTE